MAANPGMTRRQKERARQERQKDKEEKRKERRAQRTQQETLGNSGEDPDIAGIVPGPQPQPMEES